MNRTRLSQALLAATLGAVALAGCRKEEPAPTPPATPPAETTPAPAPAPVPAPAAPSASVGSVTLGNAIDANNRVGTPMSTFATGDTIHASVATDGAAPAELTAKWTHLDSSQTVAEETKNIAAGPQMTDFHISKPDGWPTGKYRLEVSLDGAVVNTSEFDVQ